MAPQGTAALVGRDEDVAALVAAAAQARVGEPRGVVVAGEAGIGKTRLVSEVVAGLDDALVLTGHAADMSTGEIPFGVLADTLRDLRHRVGQDALAPTESAALAPLLPGGTDSRVVEPARILAAALDLLTRLCTDRLLVWVVEDLHWADSATRDLVNLALRTVRGRLLVVVTVRTGDPSRSLTAEVELVEQVDTLARLPHVRRLDLSRLTDDEVHSVVRLLADDLPPRVMRSIIRLSDGVPFVVEELTAAHGRWGATTVAAALAGRVARLRPDARRLVEAAAIGDGHLRISLVEQVLNDVVEAVDAALAEAVAASLLTCDYSRDQLGFRHALLREAVDEEIGPGARRDWHRRWAEVLEKNPRVLAADPVALAIAEHWHRAGDTARSVSAAFAALPAVERTGDVDYRLELWRRILEGWDQRDLSTPVGQLTRRQALGEALRRAITSDDVLLAFLQAVERQPLQQPERLLVEAFWPVLGTSKVGLREHELARRAATEIDWLSEPPDVLTRTALVALGHFLPPSEAKRADVFLSRAEELAENNRDLLLDVAKARSDRHTRAGDPAEAVRVLEQAWALLGPDDLSQRLGFAGDLAWNYILMGRHQAADVLVSTELKTTPHLETRVELWEHVVENAMYTWLCIGEWAKARRTFERAAAWWPDDVRVSNLWLAHLDLLQQGSTDERRWREHLGVPISGGPDENDLQYLLAHAAGMRGDLGAMRDLSEPIWDDPRDDYDVVPPAVVNLSRLEADAALEDPDRPDRASAAEHLARMADALAAQPHPLAHDEAARWEVAAQLDRFHARDPREALEAALGAWTEMDHLPDVAVTHLSLAEVHAEAGDRDTAREHLVEGRRIATELDARPWLARAAAIAHRYGFTTRAQRPEDVLTGREVEVLALLADGRTNKQIAEILFITAKTASVHVSRIIAKMGASNRTEAVGIARRRGLVDTAER
ncbi:MAG TPA: AAA family ATPase [Jiangellaceae bacterium]